MWIPARRWQPQVLDGFHKEVTAHFWLKVSAKFRDIHYNLFVYNQYLNHQLIFNQGKISGSLLSLLGYTQLWVVQLMQKQ